MTSSAWRRSEQSVAGRESQHARKKEVGRMREKKTTKREKKIKRTKDEATLTENGCFASVVQTKNKDADFFAAKQSAKDFRHDKSHCSNKQC